MIKKAVGHYWEKRLNDLKETLAKNNFEVFSAKGSEETRKVVLDEIIPKINPQSISWGTSMTFISTGLYDALKDHPAFNIIDPYEQGLSWEENVERRRRSLTADLFIMGTNALTDQGALVNLDGLGNRVAALAFGPKHVVVLASRNKVVPDLEEAKKRIKNYVAPINNRRLNRNTPCATTASCKDCSSPERICNAWSIIEKSFPKGRIKIVLIDDDFGI